MASILCVAPHAIVPTADRVLELVRPDLRDDPRVHAEALEWEEAGVIEARDALASTAGAAVAAVPSLPRWICDLNRPWSGPPGAALSLLGKPAVGLATRTWLRDGALEAIHSIYTADLQASRRLAEGALGIVEPHTFGSLGSTFDQAGRGRPVARPATALIVGAPWRTAHPVGLARLIAPTLDGTPWRLQADVGQALDDAGLTLGLNPYGSLLPWSISARALAAQWFRFLAEDGEIPAATADQLVDLAWGDVYDPVLDAGLGAALAGTLALRERLERWGNEGAVLAERFRAARPGSFVLVAELREDLARSGRAADFGAALGRGLLRFVGSCAGDETHVR